MMAAQLGFEVWCDPDIAFTHRGNKVWTGNMQGAMDTFEQRAIEQTPTEAA